MSHVAQNVLAQRSGTVTIANGATVSSAFDARGFATIGFATPAALTGTAITFQVSHDNVTFVPLKTTANAAVSVTVTTSSAYTIPSEVKPWRYIKLVSGSAEGAARTITIMASAI